MGFQDVAFLLSRASFSTAFHKNYDTVESHGTSTCLNTAVGDMQGHAACRKTFVPTKLLL